MVRMRFREASSHKGRCVVGKLALSGVVFWGPRACRGPKHLPGATACTEDEYCSLPETTIIRNTSDAFIKTFITMYPSACKTMQLQKLSIEKKSRRTKSSIKFLIARRSVFNLTPIKLMTYT